MVASYHRLSDTLIVEFVSLSILELNKVVKLGFGFLCPPTAYQCGTNDFFQKWEKANVSKIQIKPFWTVFVDIHLN